MSRHLFVHFKFRDGEDSGSGERVMALHEREQYFLRIGGRCELGGCLSGRRGLLGETGEGPGEGRGERNMGNMALDV